MMSEGDRTAISTPMNMKKITHIMRNPPNVPRTPLKLLHIRQYARDMAYVLPYNAADTLTTFNDAYMKCCIIWIGQNMAFRSQE
jgi:hypothetical protein